MFKTFVLALRIEACSYCVVLHRRTSYQFVSVPIGSYLIVVHLYRFVVHSHWDSPPACCDSVRCNTMRNDRIVVLDRTCIGSCKFLLVPIVFSSHHGAIVLILHHRRTASYCIVSPSCCILLHLTASYQFMFNLCLIRIDSQIIIESNRSGSAQRRTRYEPQIFKEKIAAILKWCHSHWLVQLLATVGRGIYLNHSSVRYSRMTLNGTFQLKKKCSGNDDAIFLKTLNS